MVALQHTWALEPLARRIVQEDGPAPVLLHIDSHDDLQPPSVLVTADVDAFAAPVGQDLLRLDQPATITRFVERGLIGIGGFLAPLLHAGRIRHFVHLRPPETSLETEHRTLQRTLSPLLYFGGWGERPAIDITAGEGAGTGIPVTLTDDLGVIDALPPDAPVLVDLDMDYFCNAYDDSVSERPAVPPLERLCSDMSAFLGRLIESLAGRNVQLVTLALSPGFFPAIFWEPALELACDACRRLLSEVPPDVESAT